MLALTGTDLKIGLHGLRARLRGVLHPSALGLAPARMPKYSVMALVLDVDRLYGVGMVRDRDNWTRGAVGEWPVAAAVMVPPVAAETPADAAQPVDALTASLTQARTELHADAVVLGLPTSLLLLRVLRMPALAREELADAVLLQMDKLSPFPGDELSIGWEILSENAEQVTILAAAAPERHMQTLDQACQAAGLQIVRVDVALLARWRMLREQKLLPTGEGRQVVLIAQGGEWELLVLDNGLPVMARGIGHLVEDGDLARELMLSLFQVEMEIGALPLQEVVVVAATSPAASVLDPLRAVVQATVRCVTTPANATAADGLCLRTVEGATLDLTPAAWRHREQAAVARRRLTLGVSVAAGLWVALLAALMIGPFVTDQLTQMQKRREAAIHADYQQVLFMRERVRLIGRYQNRSGSLLNALRAICEVQPEGVDLTSISYEREDRCKLRGDAAKPELVYTFKDLLETNGPFRACNLNGGVSSKPNTQRCSFEMDAFLGEVAR